MINSAETLKTVFHISFWPGNQKLLKALMILKTCLGTILVNENIEFAEGDFEKFVRDFLDLDILLVS